MVTLLHISDLHFGGKRARKLSEAVLRAEAELRPDAVVCSGDLVEWSETNRPWQEVRAFLRRLISPVVVTPGNHDIERFNPVYRLFRPLARYRRWVEREVDTVTELHGAIIVGLGTPRRWSFHLGHISRGQLELARRAFARAPAGTVKVVTMHHGIGALGNGPVRGLVRDHIWSSGRIRRSLLDIGADLVLSGHSHFPYAERITEGGRSFVWAQAGTAGSHRFSRNCEPRNYVSVVRATAFRIMIEWWHYLEPSGSFARERSLTLSLGEPLAQAG